MNELKTLERIAEAVRRSHANIAPTYEEYYQLAYGIASSCGEAGRPYFHELCSYSPKYRQADAEKYYTYALHHANGDIGMGSVVHLTQQAGVDLDFHPNYANPSLTPPSSRARTHVFNNVESDEIEAQKMEESLKLQEAREKVMNSLPRFRSYSWPKFLDQMLHCAPSPAQRDALFLGLLTVMGSTTNWLVHTYYGEGETYPNLLNFIVGMPASGKSILNWAKQLALPFHEERLQAYEEAVQHYLQEKQAYDCLGKKKADTPVPTEPPLRLFIIPGNNSSTGIKENLINAHGIGLIFETEADTMSSAIGTDYGHWSDTLRKGYDNDEISYYRRGDHEYRQTLRSCFSVQLTGTPGQVPALIPSAEDGLYSRFLFYVLPHMHQWKNQFKKDKTDYRRKFHQWGEQWKQLLDSLRQVASSFELVLSDEQIEAFNADFSQLFGKAFVLYGNTLQSSIQRLGVNLSRICCLVSFLRAVDPLLPSGKNSENTAVNYSPEKLLKQLLKSPYIEPAPHVSSENVRDGMLSAFTLRISDDDFHAVLALAEPLSVHAAFILNAMPEEKVMVQREKSKSNQLFERLPMSFTRSEAVEEGRQLNLSERAVDSILLRAVKNDILEKKDRGVYVFKSGYIDTRTCAGRTAPGEGE